MSKLFNILFGTEVTYTGMYNNKFTYDANGNILTQLRKNQSGITINNLTYNRFKVGGRTIQNRLYSVNDSVHKLPRRSDIKEYEYPFCVSKTCLFQKKH